jgi:hypothetical protein
MVLVGYVDYYLLVLCPLTSLYYRTCGSKHLANIVSSLTGAHVALTYLVLLFILPTYYGFWTLARKTTLSPFETARAFHAPILHDQPRELDTPALLKTVGLKNLHRDLVQTPGVAAIEKIG